MHWGWLALTCHDKKAGYKKIPWIFQIEKWMHSSFMVSEENLLGSVHGAYLVLHGKIVGFLHAVLTGCQTNIRSVQNTCREFQVRKSAGTQVSRQCQQRWGTIVMPYKKIKRQCDAHGKDFRQVTEEEFRSMNVDWRYWRDNSWYNLIDEYHLRLSSGKSIHKPHPTLYPYARNFPSNHSNSACDYKFRWSLITF